MRAKAQVEQMQADVTYRLAHAKLLGAIGQQLGLPQDRLAALRKDLNPLSRFDFGILNALAHAKQWQAKERQAHETL